MFILTSNLFSVYSNIIFGMSTRVGGLNLSPYDMHLSYNVNDNIDKVSANRKLFFHNLGIHNNQIAFPKQIHSDHVLNVDSPGIYSSCDALVTNKHGLFLAITVADCTPIFLLDPVSNSIGAAHAGWRGCHTKIVKKAIDKMIAEFNADPINIITYIGPSAAACCYEIGTDVAVLFDNCYLLQKENGKYYLDMKQINVDILLKTGILQKNIEVSEYCTICNPSMFHSYRRDGSQSGRMMGIIGFKS